eukprot:GHUV01055757.1.p1 GENE.GHUV01055757.1~~GHUV01055757.1.p1  ORF type:complete len:134 (+),score=23.76 GHUV01055757.1:155-556(+)
MEHLSQRDWAMRRKHTAVHIGPSVGRRSECLSCLGTQEQPKKRRLGSAMKVALESPFHKHQQGPLFPPFRQVSKLGCSTGSRAATLLAHLSGICLHTRPVAAASCLMCFLINNLRYAAAAALLVESPAMICAL